MDLDRLCRMLARMRRQLPPPLPGREVRPLSVQVEQRHIQAGRRRSCTGCPLTLALREQTSREWGPAVAEWGPAVVTDWSVYWSQGPELGLPKDAITWLQRFDQGEAVEPITITLQMPYRALVVAERTRA